MSRPTIYTRAQWGTNENIRGPGPPDYGEVRGALVHHTVNANNCTAADVPAIIRGIYSYHVNSRGWRDIGYNFLVDRFGRVWEGRYGGIKRAVTGAHTAGYNPDLGQLVRAVDGVEGGLEVVGHGVGGGDGVFAGLDVDGAVAARGGDEALDGPAGGVLDPSGHG